MARGMEGARASLRVQRGGSGGGGRTGCSSEGGAVGLRPGKEWDGWWHGSALRPPLPASSHATYAFGGSVARPDASRITGLVAQHVVGASLASFPASPKCGRLGSSWAMGILDAPAVAPPNNPSSVRGCFDISDTCITYSWAFHPIMWPEN